MIEEKKDEIRLKPEVEDFIKRVKHILYIKDDKRYSQLFDFFKKNTSKMHCIDYLLILRMAFHIKNFFLDEYEDEKFILRSIYTYDELKDEYIDELFSALKEFSTHLDELLTKLEILNSKSNTKH